LGVFLDALVRADDLPELSLLAVAGAQPASPM
jgi:hypothetical protein